MKNIHLLPTKNGLPVQSILPHVKNYKELNHIHQNIYITSDEEYKVGDWCYDEFLLSVFQANCIMGVKTKKTSSKIILTTDPDLIKDGVQEIDDEFLEWFVKNPSCEFVEIVEELKYFNLDELRERHLKGLPHIYSEKIGYKIIIPQKESKQETLEEAIKQQFKYDNLQDAKEISSRIKVDSHPDIDNKETLENFIKSIYLSPSGGDIKGIELGAKWQAERMYSEKEVYDVVAQTVARFCPSFGDKIRIEVTKEWFEQFKKK
jgi:hypothetical protein